MRRHPLTQVVLQETPPGYAGGSARDATRLRRWCQQDAPHFSCKSAQCW